MGENPVVFDISSDEEPGQEEFEDFEDENFPEPEAADFDWLSEIFQLTENKVDDSDEVLVVGEVNSNKQRSKSKPLNNSLDDPDDDCIILDGDPDKVVAVENDSANDGDELAVIGEKGQIPCRDYPHSRHLCAKFPFSSTPHEERCALCHCYVCDSIAPCVYWGTGVSTTDHCHATDKLETWKLQRKDFQLRKIGSLQVPKLHGSSAATIAPVPDKAPSRNIVRLAPNSTARTSKHRSNATINSRPRNHVSRTTAIHPCSTPRNLTPPRVTMVGTTQPSIPIGKIHHSSFSHHSLGVRNHAIRRDRSLDISKLGSSYIPSSNLAKRKVASRVNSPADQAVPHNNNISPASQYFSSPVAVAQPQHARSNAIDPGSWQDVQPNMNIDSYKHPSSLHPNMNDVIMSATSSQVEISLQSTSQSDDCGSFYQNQHQSMNQDTNQVGGLNRSASQNDFLLQTRSESGMFHAESNGQSTSVCLFQPSNQIDSATEPRSDANISWINARQDSSSCLAENSQYQCMESSYEPFPVKETNSSFTGEFNGHPLHLESFGIWQFENQSVPLASDCSVLFEPNILSAESTAIDAGMLVFDFEPSWNGLT